MQRLSGQCALSCPGQSIPWAGKALCSPISRSVGGTGKMGGRQGNVPRLVARILPPRLPEQTSKRVSERGPGLEATRRGTPETEVLGNSLGLRGNEKLEQPL